MHIYIYIYIYYLFLFQILLHSDLPGAEFVGGVTLFLQASTLEQQELEKTRSEICPIHAVRARATEKPRSRNVWGFPSHGGPLENKSLLESSSQISRCLLREAGIRPFVVRVSLMLRSFGQSFLGSHLHVGGFHPLETRS